MTGRCENCVFWNSGECRRFPPAWVSWPGDNQHPIRYDPVPSFAYTAPDQWCGEFKKKTED